MFFCNEVTLQVTLLPKGLATRLIGFLRCNEVTLPQPINEVERQGREIKPPVALQRKGRVTSLPKSLSSKFIGNETKEKTLSKKRVFEMIFDL